MRPTAVAEAAFELWVQRGYAATSWIDLAEATGVSVRTLNRHFPSKADIAWVGIPSAIERLNQAFSQIGDDVPVADAIRRAVAVSISHDPRIQRSNRAWLRVVSEEPEIAGMAQRAYRPWIEALAAHVHRRCPTLPPANSLVIASAYQAAAFAALCQWALGEHGDSADFVDGQLRHLSVRTGTPPN